MDTIIVDEDETPSDIPLFHDTSAQASLPKMKSVSVTVQVKGNDKGNAVYI